MIQFMASKLREMLLQGVNNKFNQNSFFNIVHNANNNNRSRSLLFNLHQEDFGAECNNNKCNKSYYRIAHYWVIGAPSVAVDQGRIA